jgi:hypothetical protein
LWWMAAQGRSVITAQHRPDGKALIQKQRECRGSESESNYISQATHASSPLTIRAGFRRIRIGHRPPIIRVHQGVCRTPHLGEAKLPDHVLRKPTQTQASVPSPELSK